MTLKNQFKKIKENWLLLVVVLVIVVFLSSGNSVGTSFNKVMYQESATYDDLGGFAEPAIARVATSSFYGEQDFAPDVEERRITKNANVGVEVKRGEFKEKEQELKDIVDATDSILTSENSYQHGREGYKVFSGNYQIKVEADKASSVIEQVKQLGEVTNFNENAQDITGSYIRLEDQLATERARLARYKQLFEEAENLQEKLDLTDRLFSQERTIKYLEDSLLNKDRRIEYTTISVQMNEKQSSYAGVAIVKFSELVRKLVNSFNELLSLVFYIFPYAIVALLSWIVYRRVRR